MTQLPHSAVWRPSRVHGFLRSSELMNVQVCEWQRVFLKAVTLCTRTDTTCTVCSVRDLGGTYGRGQTVVSRLMETSPTIQGRSGDGWTDRLHGWSFCLNFTRPLVQLTDRVIVGTL